ncbi:MAG TPA: hypothetical protein ENH57_03150, partial [Actinobacteria bacterium]|nr:hypothetical protein [Actinomycetota bacterium]
FSTNDGQNWSSLARNIVGTTYQHKNLKARTTYKYRLLAANTDAEVNENEALTVSATTAFPQPPSNLQGVAENAVNVALTWDAPGGSVTIKGYKIYRNNKEIADTNNTTYSDRVSPKTTYDYFVKAYDKSGYFSDPSNTVSSTTLAMPHGFFKDNTDVCAGCHRTHTATGSALITKQIQKNLCYTCHDGTGSNYNVKAEFGEIGPAKGSTHPIPTNGLKCSDCHDPHGSKDQFGNYYARTLRAKKPDGSFVYQGNEFCGACHGANSPLTGKPGEDHLANFTGTPHDTNLAEPPSGTKIKCVNCHQKHASNVSPLLNELLNGLRLTGNNNSVCFSCHKLAKYAFGGRDLYEQSKHSRPSETGIVDTIDSGYAMGLCDNCHNPHGTPFDDYRRKDKNELCATCHDKKAPPTQTVAMKGTYKTKIGGNTGALFPTATTEIKVRSIALGKASSLLGSEDSFKSSNILVETSRDIYIPPSQPIKIYLNSNPTVVGTTLIGTWSDPLIIVGTRAKNFDITNYLNNHKNEDVFVVLEFPVNTRTVGTISADIWGLYEDKAPLNAKQYYAYQGTTKYSNSAHADTLNPLTVWPDSAETGSGIGSGGAKAGECINCHNPHGKKDAQGNPIDKMLQDKEEDLCFSCHDNPAASARGINIKERFTASPEKSAGGLSIDEWSRHGIYDKDQENSNTKIECTSCHNPHLNNAENKVIDPENKTQLFTATMTDPVTGEQIPDVVSFCMKCHDKSYYLRDGSRYLFMSNWGITLGTIPGPTWGLYNSIREIPYSGNWHGDAAATGEFLSPSSGPSNTNRFYIDRDRDYGPLKAPYKRGMGPLPCTTCHDEHGSSQVFHIKEKINGQNVSIGKSYPGNNMVALCEACHEKTGITNAHKLNCEGGRCHPNYISTTFGLNYPNAPGFCTMCHSHTTQKDGVGGMPKGKL